MYTLLKRYHVQQTAISNCGHSFLSFFLFLKTLHVIQAGCPLPTYPALSCHKQYTCSVAHVVGWHSWQGPTNVSFGTTKSPVLPHRVTAGSLHCTKQRTIKECNQRDVQTAAVVWCVIADDKDTFGNAETITSISQQCQLSDQTLVQEGLPPQLSQTAFRNETKKWMCNISPAFKSRF